MNLTYKILWFEDEYFWAQPLIRDIKSFVEEMGFIFLDPRFERDNSNIDNINYNEYDLILMDYNLSSKEKGDVLIKKIREQNFYSEIIFYSTSGAPVVRKAALDNELDGVYCADRPANSFLPKVKDVIKATVKKVLDLNTIRGIVMAETSNIDEKMLEIIYLYINTLEDENKNDFLNKSRKKLLDSMDKKIKKIKTDAADEFYYELVFDSSQKWRTVLEIVKNQIPEKEEITKLYDSEIINKRNRLAHVKEKQNEFGKIQLVDKEFVFNEETSKEILQNIKKHEANIESILTILKSR